MTDGEVDRVFATFNVASPALAAPQTSTGGGAEPARRLSGRG